LPDAFIFIPSLIAAGETPVKTSLARLRTPLATVAALLTLTAVLAACAVTSGDASTPAATAEPTYPPVAKTCAEVPGFADATPVNIASTEFPKDTIVVAQTSAGGPGRFTVKEYEGCAPNTDTSLTVQTAKGPKAFFDLQQFYGWSPSPTFPADGQYQAMCGANSCLDFGQEHTHFLDIGKITTLPNSLVRFHLSVTVPPDAPVCGSNFTNSPIKGYQLTTFFNAPLPPLTRAVPDDASGGLRGEDLCSAGTVATITSFLNRALPYTGWTKLSDPKCVFSEQCWTKGGNAISWQVTDPKDWMIAYRQPI
jgi:hypothetical protein